MELLKFGIFAAVIVFGALWLGRLLGSTARNQDGTHGDGLEGAPSDIDSV